MDGGNELVADGSALCLRRKLISPSLHSRGAKADGRAAFPQKPQAGRKKTLCQLSVLLSRSNSVSRPLSTASTRRLLQHGTIASLTWTPMDDGVFGHFAILEWYL